MKCILLLLLYFVIGCSSEVDNKDFYLLDNGQKEYFDTIDELFNKLPEFDQLFSDVVIALNTIEEGSRDLNNVYLHMSKELITNDFRDCRVIF
ncbi:MAG: hypothetical protein LRY71_00125 [Bacillaceae bacterium]|nr:hypothetical protein [Bacillaceae bacterium]